MMKSDDIAGAGKAGVGRALGRSGCGAIGSLGVASASVYGNMLIAGTLTSDGTTEVNFPTLQFAGFYGGRPVYTDNGLTSGMTHSLSWETTVWLLGQVSPAAAWASASAVATPDLASGWTAQGSATGTPVITASS